MWAFTWYITLYAILVQKWGVGAYMVMGAYKVLYSICLYHFVYLSLCPCVRFYVSESVSLSPPSLPPPSLSLSLSSCMRFCNSESMSLSFSGCGLSVCLSIISECMSLRPLTVFTYTFLRLCVLCHHIYVSMSLTLCKLLFSARLHVYVSTSLSLCLCRLLSSCILFCGSESMSLSSSGCLRVYFSVALSLCLCRLLSSCILFCGSESISLSSSVFMYTFYVYESISLSSSLFMYTFLWL